MNPIMEYFKYDHLPPHLQAVSKPLGDLARMMDEMIPDSAEKSAGLRKLLEAKDCLVRSSIGKTLNGAAAARTILHITLGGPDFEPTKADIDHLVDLFQNAIIDTENKVVIVATNERANVNVDILSVTGTTEVEVVGVKVDAELAESLSALSNTGKVIPGVDGPDDRDIGRETGVRGEVGIRE